MAGAKRYVIKSVVLKAHRRLQKAMEMVAASKMRRSQDAMEATRPYAETMRKVISLLANGSLGSISILILRNVKPNVLVTSSFLQTVVFGGF